MKEKHITVLEPTFEKLQLIGEFQDRKNRAIVTRMINDLYENMMNWDKDFIKFVKEKEDAYNDDL